MDDSLCMRCGQRAGHLRGQRNRLGHGEGGAALGEPLAQRLALQIFHDEIKSSIGQLPVLEDLDQAAVTDDVDRPGFVQEPLRDLLIIAELAVQELDRDPPANPMVLGLINDPHAAFTKLSHYAEVSE